VFLSKFKNFKITKLFSRNTLIPKIFFKKTVLIYKGNIFARILFNKYHIGFKAGEFSVTRKPFNFPQKTLKKSKR
jgi:ribosomal protein S19